MNAWDDAVDRFARRPSGWEVLPQSDEPGWSDRQIDFLREQYATSRISLEEFDRRVGAALLHDPAEAKRTRPWWAGPSKVGSRP